MRRKKHKNTRRAVKFYQVHYKFREPYKVLLDGNFVHVTCLANLSALDEHVPRLLGANCKLYVTPCVMHELKSLGKEYNDAWCAARQLALHKCGHDDPMSAADCLLSQAGTANKDHWWLATQDRRLREQLQKIPGCPCLFASVNGLHLEVPSGLDKSLAKEEEEKHRGVQDHERRSEALKDLEADRPKGKSIFRRKKAKGPNPLSVKKSSTKAAPTQPRPAQADSSEAAPDSTSSAAKKRRRKKNKASAAAAAAAAAAGDD